MDRCRELIRRAPWRRLLRLIRAKSGSHFADAEPLENGRPVFLQDVVRRAESDANAVALEGLSRGSFRIREIRVREAFREQWPQNSWQVKSFFPRIRADHDRAAQRVGNPGLKSGMQLNEVTGIIVENRRQQKRSKEMAGGTCSHGGAEALSIAFAAFTVAGQRVTRLADSRSGRGTQDLGRRYALVQEELKFLE